MNTPGTIQLTHVRNMLRLRERERRIVPYAATIGQLQAREFPEIASGGGGGGINWIVDGRPRKAEFPLRPGQRVIAAQVPGGVELVSLLVYALVSAVIGAGISYGISMLMGRPKAPRKPKDDSATYAWQGGTNTIAQGTPRAQAFGENRLWGQIVHYFRRCENENSKEQQLFVILALADGPLTSVGQVRKDTDGLTTGLRFQDKFDIDQDDLGDSDDWTRSWGTDETVMVDAGLAQHDAVGSSGYTIDGDYGQSFDNCYVKGRIQRLDNDSQMGVAINMDDVDNYYAIVAVSDASVSFIKRVSGVTTVLKTKNAADNVIVELVRLNGTISAKVDGVVIKTVEAGGDGLDADGVGIVTLGAGVGCRMDDVYTGGASQVDGEFIRGCLINGVNATAFEGIEAWVRLGRQKQEKIPEADFRITAQPWPINRKLTNRWMVYQCHGPMTGAYINLAFSRGLYDQSGGDVEENTVYVQAQFKSGGGGWTDVPGGSVGGDHPGAFAFTDDTVQPFARTIFANGLFAEPVDKVQIRLRVIGGEAVEDNRIGNQVDSAEIVELSENHDKTYPGSAIVALKIKATDQLSGALPEISFITRGRPVPRIKKANGSNPGTKVQYIYSDNPAWVGCHIALDKDNGLGNWFGLDDLDTDAWRRFAHHCAKVIKYREVDPEPLYITNETEAVAADQDYIVVTEDPTGNFDQWDFVELESEGVNRITLVEDLTGGRWKLTLTYTASRYWPAGSSLRKVQLGENIVRKQARFNGVFDEKSNAWEALMQVCRIGRGVPYLFGNKLSVRIENTAQVSQHFNDSSIVAGTMKIHYLGSNERVERIEAQFVDKDQDYQRDVEPAIIPRKFLEHAEVTETLGLDPGCTDRTQARADANYFLRARNRLRKKIEFEVPLDGLAAEPGDVISVGSTIPLWSDRVSRANGTMASFTLDHALVVPVDTIVALFRTPGSPSGTVATITSGQDTYAAGSTITTDAPPTPLEDAPVAIGLADAVITLWRIVNVTVKTDLTVLIEAVQYDGEVYQLIGWPHGPIDPPIVVNPPDEEPPECLDFGSYFFNTVVDPLAEEEGPCTDLGDCGPPHAEPGCTWTKYRDTWTITVTGPGAGCITIGAVADNGFFFHVGKGCGGQEFCITVRREYTWRCCPPGNPENPDIFCMILSEHGTSCVKECEQCFMICEPE